MSTFELDDAAVAQTEEMLRETGERVMAEADQAAGDVTSLSGGGWQGAANSAAGNKQNNEFLPAMQKLLGEINRISEALGLGRVGTTSEDQQGADQLAAVNPDVGNFTRL